MWYHDLLNNIWDTANSWNMFVEWVHEQERMWDRQSQTRKRVVTAWRKEREQINAIFEKTNEKREGEQVKETKEREEIWNEVTQCELHRHIRIKLIYTCKCLELCLAHKWTLSMYSQSLNLGYGWEANVCLAIVYSPPCCILLIYSPWLCVYCKWGWY